MAGDLYFEPYYFSAMEHPPSVATATNQMPSGGDASPSGTQDVDLITAFKQGLKNYKNVFGGLLPFKRKTSQAEETETCTTNTMRRCEHIEMFSMEKQLKEPGKGHHFVVEQLNNPTWCDECGDFIWGVYKQCIRCQNCQLTCHHKCQHLVTLDCKAVTNDDDIDEGAVLAEETSLSDLSDASPSTELASEPATEKDETDSGYRSGTIPDEKLPRKPSQATLNREELKKRITEFNKQIPGANFAMKDPSNEAFQGFIKVTLNFVRPINMSLGARPPSIYEILTKEHIVEQSTLNVSFYMPRDTVKSIHIQSDTTTKEVVAALLKKFHILDHPRKFAMYEQELANNKIAKLRRVSDCECPLRVCLGWDQENLHNHRLVLQENETGEIDWSAFSTPELQNFMRVLDREEGEYLSQLQYKYKVMKRIMLQRMKELRKERDRVKRESAAMGESHA